ncbi:hypothetical protein ACOMHN_067133 [Nucella lapillus]
MPRAMPDSIYSAQQGFNVALNKNYSQVSKYWMQGPSSDGANGDTSGTFGRGNCIHSTEPFDNPWWQVDLGRNYPVSRIDIWARNYFKERLYPSTITVDQQTCGSITSFPYLNRKREVTCSSVTYGRTVRITRQGSDMAINMCEMQIWVPREVSQCAAGKYGSACSSDCSINCGKGSGKNFCFQSSAYCYDGCVDGWYGDQCSSRCSPGCQNIVCGRQSAQCNCQTGYRGNACTDCQYGYYKTSSGTCEKCSSNCRSQLCDSQTGKCDGCVAGWYGAMCTLSCQTAHCQQCDQDTGTVCSQCTLNSFLLPPQCTECEDGRYGAGCTQTCGQCKGAAVCNKTDGHCSNCQPGWKLPTCNTEISDGGDKETVNTNAIIGSVLGGSLIIGICIILAVIILKRRSGENRQNNQASNDLNMSPTSPRPGAPGDKEERTTGVQAVQEQEQPYEIVEDRAKATSDVSPEASAVSDTVYQQYEADSANPYDELTVQYCNTGDVHLYGH